MKRRRSSSPSPTKKDTFNQYYSKSYKSKFWQILQYLLKLLSRFFIMTYEFSLCRKQRHKKNSKFQIKFQPSSYIENTILSNDPQQKKPNLVLDLEGTLVRSNPKPWNDNGPEEIVTVTYESGAKQKFYVRKRPFLKRFLEIAERNFNIIIYTAQIKEYADPIIDTLGVRIDKRFYRQNCLDLKYGRYQKELLKITRNLKNVVMIDNSKNQIQGDLENSFLIKTYKGELTDNELIQFQQILVTLAKDRRSIYNIQSVIEEIKDQFYLSD